MSTSDWESLMFLTDNSAAALNITEVPENKKNNDVSNLPILIFH